MGRRGNLPTSSVVTRNTVSGRQHIVGGCGLAWVQTEVAGGEEMPVPGHRMWSLGLKEQKGGAHVPGKQILTIC